MSFHVSVAVSNFAVCFARLSLRYLLGFRVPPIQTFTSCLHREHRTCIGMPTYLAFVHHAFQHLDSRACWKSCHKRIELCAGNHKIVQVKRCRENLLSHVPYPVAQLRKSTRLSQPHRQYRTLQQTGVAASSLLRVEGGILTTYPREERGKHMHL